MLDWGDVDVDEEQRQAQPRGAGDVLPLCRHPPARGTRCHWSRCPARNPRGHGARRRRHRWERKCRWREMGAAIADEVGGARRRREPDTEDAGRAKELSMLLPVGEGWPRADPP
jgi:hypothetical protein